MREIFHEGTVWWLGLKNLNFERSLSENVENSGASLFQSFSNCLDISSNTAILR